MILQLQAFKNLLQSSDTCEMQDISHHARHKTGPRMKFWVKEAFLFLNSFGKIKAKHKSIQNLCRDARAYDNA